LRKDRRLRRVENRMRYAAIDIGTNAVLLLIIDRKVGFGELRDLSTITRLGEGLVRSGRLIPSAMERTLSALETYRAELDAYQARVAACFGTSALREAENREEFIEMARQRAGLEVRVFSEYEEAFYTYLSVKHDPLIPGNNFVIVDIGGGSTEISRATRERLIDYVSLPVGTVKLTEQFIRHDPPAHEELESLRQFIRNKLPFHEQEEAGTTIVGIAGTMTTLAAMLLGLEKFDKEKIHGLTVPVGELDGWIERLSRMPVRERREVPGMEPGREDLLLQGMILMREIVASFQGKEFAVSTYGARYGVMYDPKFVGDLLLP
jgi:exopolyphosphatase/guanosine-5'-triphosphate,3'-diphosphate pyrophosphatase